MNTSPLLDLTTEQDRHVHHAWLWTQINNPRSGWAVTGSASAESVVVSVTRHVDGESFHRVEPEVVTWQELRNEAPYTLTLQHRGEIRDALRRVGARVSAEELLAEAEGALHVGGDCG